MALYDPREFPSETVEAPSLDFSVAEFLAWARTKPADGAYRTGYANLCALGQFGSATGRTHLHKWFDPELKSGIAGLNDALGFDTGEPLTFGALVKRLEAL